MKPTVAGRILLYVVVALICEAAAVVLLFGIAQLMSTCPDPATMAASRVFDTHLALSDPLHDSYQNLITERNRLVNTLSLISHLGYVLNSFGWLLVVLPMVGIFCSFVLERGRETAKPIAPDPSRQEMSRQTTLVVAGASMCLILISVLAGFVISGPQFLNSGLFIGSQVLGGMICLWLLTAFCLIWPLIFITRCPQKLDSILVVAFSPCILPILSIVLGAACWPLSSASNEPKATHPAAAAIYNVAFAEQILGFLFWAFVPAAIATIYALRGRRVMVASFLPIQIWFWLLANFVSGMAVSNNWL